MCPQNRLGWLRLPLCCRYTNRLSAEVLVLDEPSRMESAILGMLRMVNVEELCWVVRRSRYRVMGGIAQLETY